MKRIILAVMAMALPILHTAAQTDTITGRCDRYFYNEWYDECYLYEKACSNDWPYVIVKRGLPLHHDTLNNRVLLSEQRIANRMAIKGVAVMTAEIDTNSDINTSVPDTLTHKIPEYIKIYQGNGEMQVPVTTTLLPHLTTLLDSVRWDTAATKVMRLPRCSHTDPADSSSWMTCLVCEVYFDQPVVVDSLYYIGGTVRNNFHMFQQPYEHIPTLYAYVYEIVPSDFCELCIQANRLYCGTEPFDEMPWYLWYNFGAGSANFGPFLPIVDFYNLDAGADAPHEGTVSGGGRYPAMHEAVVSATPAPGYSFYQWSDGNTDNPRTVVMTADTTLRAFFLATDD